MVYLTRVETFNAAHKLFNPNWTEEKNKAVFGKCANKNWHGHNYELHVTIKGEPKEETGYVFNAKTLSVFIKEVTEKIDHLNLNIDVEFMQGKMTSAENLAIGIWNELYEKIKLQGAELHGIKLYETPKNYVEYFGN